MSIGELQKDAELKAKSVLTMTSNLVVLLVLALYGAYYVASLLHMFERIGAVIETAIR